MSASKNHADTLDFEELEVLLRLDVTTFRVDRCVECHTRDSPRPAPCFRAP